jgi:hypothetical protein
MILTDVEVIPSTGDLLARRTAIGKMAAGRR